MACQIEGRWTTNHNFRFKPPIKFYRIYTMRHFVSSTMTIMSFLCFSCFSWAFTNTTLSATPPNYPQVAVVSNSPERMSTIPGGEGVGGEARVYLGARGKRVPLMVLRSALKRPSCCPSFSRYRQKVFYKITLGYLFFSRASKEASSRWKEPCWCWRSLYRNSSCLGVLAKKRFTKWSTKKDLRRT